MLKRPSYHRRPCVPRPSRSRKLRLIKPSDKQQLLLIDADMPQPELGCAATRSWPRRSCRSWQQRYRQRGQALPEMLVVAGAMALLWIGVQELSSMRMAVLEAAQSSRHWAFALARAHTPPAKDEGMHLAVLEVAQAHDSAISADARTLARDWLDLPGRWAAVRAWAGQGTLSGTPSCQRVPAIPAGRHPRNNVYNVRHLVGAAARRFPCARLVDWIKPWRVLIIRGGSGGSARIGYRHGRT
ncbi:putative pilus assembly protein [Bordetella holmesii 70147]|nr:putative pilus assembly protein [Bordetella holmesii 70147]